MRDAVRESDHVRLARAAIEAYVVRNEVLDEEEAPARLRAGRAGVFVSIKKRGVLRGCIGTIESACRSIAGEIIRNAIQAATCDPRFVPVGSEELAELDVSVDVLRPAEEIADASYLDPKAYGIIVSCGMRRGLLLPNLEGVETAEDQVAIACQKGGIRPDEPFSLQRFKVDRFC